MTRSALLPGRLHALLAGRLHAVGDERLDALLRAVVDRSLATLRTVAFWLAVALPAAYLIAFVDPVGPLGSLDGLAGALGLHVVALVTGHSRHRDGGV